MKDNGVRQIPPVGKCELCHKPIWSWEEYFTCVEDGALMCRECMKRVQRDKLHFLPRRDR